MKTTVENSVVSLKTRFWFSWVRQPLVSVTKTLNGKSVKIETFTRRTAETLIRAAVDELRDPCSAENIEPKLIEGLIDAKRSG